MRGLLTTAATATAALLLSGCGQMPPGTGPLPEACHLVSAGQVAAVIGTAVGAATGGGATCTFRVLDRAVGNYDPSASPAPNALLQSVALTVSSGTADAAAQRVSHGPLAERSPVAVAHADAAVQVLDIHTALVFVQRGSVVVEIAVMRGLTMDAYLARRLAGVITANLAAGVVP